MAHDKDPSYVLAAGTVFPAFTIIIVAFRFLVRNTQKAKYGADDWLALVALVSNFFLYKGLQKYESFLTLQSGIPNRSWYPLDHR